MTSPETASLSRALGELQRQVRDLATGNPLNKGSIQDAAGNYVSLSNLAFGQVATTFEGVGAVSLTGLPEASGSTGWVYAPIPQLRASALTRSGRVRVDWASLLACQSSENVTVRYSYALVFQGPPEDKGSVFSTVAFPDDYRAVHLQSPSGAGTTASYGSFAFHENLVPGWYTTVGAFKLDYSPSKPAGQTPAGSADNPRIALTPF